MTSLELGRVTDRRPPFKYSALARVWFSDTDAQGIVYYGRYLPYFDHARVEYHRHLGTTGVELTGGMELVIPPRIPEDKSERVQRLAVEAFVATDCEGMARADCFVRDDGEVLVNELNTIPGFTATSVYAELFEASGIPYPDLLDRLVELALERHERRGKLEF